MSFGETLRQLFREKDKTQKEEEDIIKSLALAACEGKHKELIQCYKASWVGGCQTEMESFWKCVNDNKVFEQPAKSPKAVELIAEHLDPISLICPHAILEQKVKLYKKNNLGNKNNIPGKELPEER